MSVVGELALWTALFLAAWASGASFAGAATRRPEVVESGVRATVACAAMLGVASVGLWAALLGHDFALEYVAAHTTMNTPTVYRLTAFWGGPGGAILWWSLSLAVCSSVETRSRRRWHAPAAPRAAGALGAILTLSLLALCFLWNPFDRAEWVPGDGRGLAPALQNPWAAPHLVALYPGYAVAMVAAVVGVLAARPLGDRVWRAAVLGWALAAWCLLTAAIALGMRWAYTEPSLGAGWSWDARSSANIVLWLAAAGLIRSFFVRGPRAAPGGTRRRAPGMYAVYLGLVILLAGLVARGSWREEVVRLQPGQTAELRDPYRSRWRLVSQGASRDEAINYLSTGVAVEAWRGTASAGIVAAERRQYIDSAQRAVSEPAMKPGIRSFAGLDLYLLLTEMRGELAELRVSFRPLVACVWVGWVVIFGGALTVAAQLTARSRSSGAEGAVTPA